METAPSLSRREFLGLAAGAALALPSGLRAARARPISLGLCLYGMGRQGLVEVLRQAAAIGYENIEPFLAPGYPTDPAVLSTAARRGLRLRLDELGLAVSGLLLRDQTLGVDGAEHARNLETIKIGAQMAHDLYSEKAPPLEAIMGGRSADWAANQNRLGDRLADWAKTASASGVRISVKAHAGQAVDTPAKLLWLLHRVGNPALGVDYDYSHFEPAGLSLTDSLTALLPAVRYIHAKDARVVAGKVQYLLPGEGDIDYRAYFSLLRRLGYSGPVVVEVSRQIFTRPGFDFLAAAKQSFAVLAAARMG